MFHALEPLPVCSWSLDGQTAYFICTVILIIYYNLTLLVRWDEFGSSPCPHGPCYYGAVLTHQPLWTQCEYSLTASMILKDQTPSLARILVTRNTLHFSLQTRFSLPTTISKATPTFHQEIIQTVDRGPFSFFLFDQITPCFPLRTRVRPTKIGS